MTASDAFAAIIQNVHFEDLSNLVERQMLWRRWLQGQLARTSLVWATRTVDFTVVLLPRSLIESYSPDSGNILKATRHKVAFIQWQKSKYFRDSAV